MPPVNLKAAASGIAAAAAAISLVVGVTLHYEGWELTGYGDPAVGAKLATACGGVTRGVQLGKTYSDADCRSRTAQAMVEHAMAIDPYLPANTPPPMRGSFLDWTYNLGPDNFIRRSGIPEAMRAGDYRLACRRINQHDDGRPAWVYAGKVRVCDDKGCRMAPRIFKGLVKRRACERALCESAITGKPFEFERDCQK